jgi:hypothetical protein
VGVGGVGQPGQKGAVRQHFLDGQVPVGRHPPQQVGAGGLRGAPQAVAGVSPVGEQQHAGLQGWQQALGQGSFAASVGTEHCVDDSAAAAGHQDDRA